MHVSGSMEIKRKFDCSCCGACCRHLDIIPNFPYPSIIGKNGICIYLNQDTNLCTIYDTRPLICRVDEQYDLNINNVKNTMSRSEYYKLQHEICKILNDDNR